MCDAGNHAEGSPVEALPANAEWKGEVLPLEPVDELTVLTVCDNAMDMLLPDEGPAKRLSLAGMGRYTPMLEAPTLQEGKVPDAPLAQHGFSALVEIRKGSQVRRLLFDTGVTPDGCADNLRRLGRDPADIGVDKLHAVIGGFHLTGPLFEPIIGDTIGALEQLAPDVIIPAHCTGWKATHAIARHLPGAFIQNSVGTTFHFSAVPTT